MAKRASAQYEQYAPNKVCVSVDTSVQSLIFIIFLVCFSVSQKQVCHLPTTHDTSQHI